MLRRLLRCAMSVGSPAAGLFAFGRSWIRLGASVRLPGEVFRKIIGRPSDPIRDPVRKSAMFPLGHPAGVGGRCARPVRSDGPSLPRSLLMSESADGGPAVGDWSACIVAIATNGDTNAFAALFRHFAPRVKSYLLRCHMDAAKAEELAQETLL